MKRLDGHIGIIIPAYNAERTIGRAIRSVAAQTLRHNDIRLIIIDDASTDDTLSEITRALYDFPFLEQRTIVITLEHNSGAAAAYAEGLRHAGNVEWMARLDADDAFAPDALSRLLSLAKESGADIIAGAYEERGKTYRPQGGDLNNLALTTANFSLCNKIFRRELLNDAPNGRPLSTVPGIDCWDDLSLSSRLMALGKTAILDGQPIYHYTFTPGSLSRSAREKILTQRMACAEMLTAWFEANALADEFRPFILRMQFIAKAKMLSGAGRAERLEQWLTTFPDTTSEIMSPDVMSPHISLPLRLIFRGISVLPPVIVKPILRLIPGRF